MSAPVQCLGCGREFTRKDWYAHRADCVKCRACGHSVVMRVNGCSCCEDAA